VGLRSLGRIVALSETFSGQFAEAAADDAEQAELARARDGNDAAFTRLAACRAQSCTRTAVDRGDARDGGSPHPPAHPHPTK
jgi:hypothetical protein